MIRLWFVFILFAVSIHFGIVVWQNMTGKERWTLTKSVGYSIIVSALAMLLMSILVILF